MTLKKDEIDNSIAGIRSLIEQNESFLIVSHEKPDGDAIGSQLALLIALKKMGKKAIAVAETAPEQYRLLPQFETLLSAEEYKNIVTANNVCIVLDSSNLERIPIEPLPEGILIINIDHHADNALFGSVNYVNSDAAATGILIYRLLRGLGTAIDSDIAENLYAAIITDTGRFSFSNVNDEVFEVIAELVRSGASPVKMTNMLYKNYSFRRAMVFGRALSTMQSHLGGKVVTMELSYSVIKDLGIEHSETDGLVEYLQGIKEQEAAFLLKEFSPQKIRVSLRSRGKINVMSIAEKHNGGGHIAASGCTLKMPLEEAKRLLVEECGSQMD